MEHHRLDHKTQPLHQVQSPSVADLHDRASFLHLRRLLLYRDLAKKCRFVQWLGHRSVCEMADVYEAYLSRSCSIGHSLAADVCGRPLHLWHFVLLCHLLSLLQVRTFALSLECDLDLVEASLLLNLTHLVVVFKHNTKTYLPGHSFQSESPQFYLDSKQMAITTRETIGNQFIQLHNIPDENKHLPCPSPVQYWPKYQYQMETPVV